MADQVAQEVLFEITRDKLETGMRGYPVGYCTTSTVDPEKGLFYGGLPLSEIGGREPMEALFLLYNGREGTESEVSDFSDDIEARASCSPDLISHIQALPKEGHPMKLFAAAILIAAMYEGSGDYKEDCLNVVAKMPLIAAAVINHHAGWGNLGKSQPELGYIENFTKMLNVPGADYDALVRVFKLFNILHYDHGGGNLSAFIGKGVASGLEDMYGSLAAAMCALAGPRHGKANQDSLEFVKKVLEELGTEATAQDVGALVKRMLEEKQLIYGFGHAVLRVEDPRATLLYRVAKELYPEDPLVKIALLLREEAPKVLSKNPKISDPYPNVDAISGTVLSAAGFPYPEYFTVLFGMARCLGIARQIVYERLEAREEKGTPIIRPKYYYKEPL